MKSRPGFLNGRNNWGLEQQGPLLQWPPAVTLQK